MVMFNITPSWSAVYTAAGVEAEWIRFKFKGPGIYHGKDGYTILAVPHNVPLMCDAGRWNIWRNAWPPEQEFLFMVYEGEDIADSVNALCNAPTRE